MEKTNYCCVIVHCSIFFTHCTLLPCMTKVLNVFKHLLKKVNHRCYFIFSSQPQSDPVSFLQVSYNEAMELQLYLEYHLKPTWDWLITVMDSTEAQLRFGSVLSDTTDPTHPSHPMHHAVLGAGSRLAAAAARQRERTREAEPRLLQTGLESRRRSRLAPGHRGFTAGKTT